MAQPLPQDAAGQEREYRDLITASLKGQLSVADDERLHALAGQRTEREARGLDAAVAARQAPPTAPDEYAKLIKKSVTSPLSAGEQARLEQLAGERAVRDEDVDVDR